MMSSRRLELLIITALLAAALAFGFVVIPIAIDLGINSSGTGLSPRFMPQLATVGLALALAFGLAQLALGKESSRAESPLESTGGDHPLRALGAVMISLLFAYYGFAIGGFYLGGIAMAMIMTLLLGERKALIVIFVPVLVLASIYLIFELGLQIKLPKSDLFSGIPI